MADQSRPVTGDPAPSEAADRTIATVDPSLNAPRNQGEHYPDPDASRKRATFVHNFVLVVLSCIFCIGFLCFVIYLIWLAILPRNPTFLVETLTLSNFNISSNSLISGDWDANLIVYNQNSRNSLYYNYIHAAISYKSDTISETNLPPFVQGAKNETAVRVRFTSLMAYFYDGDSIYGEGSNGEISVDVSITVKVNSSAWWDRSRTFTVYCSVLLYDVSTKSNGRTLVGSSKKCTYT